MNNTQRRLQARQALSAALAALLVWSIPGSTAVAKKQSPDGNRPVKSARTRAAGSNPKAARDGAGPRADSPGDMPSVPDPKQLGGEPEGVVQIANLIYAGVKSSHCFSDHFLVKAEQDSAISTSRRFHAVKLASDELFNFPLVVMTGEGAFELTSAERENLRQYVQRGGFLLASAGCSSPEWDRSFRREMSLVFPENSLQPIGIDHTLFNTVYEIKELTARHGTPRPLEGVTFGGRLGVVYSSDGLNDTEHTQGCCCCGGNEITNCISINVNILAYSLLY
ncbi:MAG: DUF4159 domain-containing protein [Planctomycetaceae bacterium]